ncbi:MAG: hypothetical protein ACKVOU_12500 [Cytophagales bacterium]
MKKSNITQIGLYLIAAAIILTAPSCSKEEAVAPTVIVPPVTAWTGTLYNKTDVNANRYLDVISKTFVTNGNFDIAYGNGSVVGNDAFIGGPTSLSIFTYYAVVGSNVSEFYLLPVAQQAKFDTLKNQLAVAGIATSGTKTAASNGIGTESVRINTSGGLANGLVFAMKLRSQTPAPTWVVAKVTSAPTGTATTPGNVSLSLKW